MDYTIFPKKTTLFVDAHDMGFVTCSYERLCDLFNLPFDGDGKDVDVEWDILLANAHPVAIYNYRSGPAYNDNLGYEDIPKIETWKVKGHFDNDLQIIKEILGDAKTFEISIHLQDKNKETLIKRLRGIADHIEDGKLESDKHTDHHSWTLEEKQAE